jgi:hypothetical protein
MLFFISAFSSLFVWLILLKVKASTGGITDNMQSKTNTAAIMPFLRFLKHITTPDAAANTPNSIT